MPCWNSRDLKIRRRRVSTTAAVSRGEWGEVAVVWREKLTFKIYCGGGGRRHDKLSGAFYDVKCNFLKSMQVVSAIPKHLLDKAREKQVDKRSFLAEKAFQLSPNTTIDLHKMKNRDYYWLLINKDDVKIKATPKWARDLQVVDLNLDTFFNRVKNVCKNNKLKEFYFKLLHRIVVTKKELSLLRYGIRHAVFFMPRTRLNKSHFPKLSLVKTLLF